MVGALEVSSIFEKISLKYFQPNLMAQGNREQSRQIFWHQNKNYLQIWSEFYYDSLAVLKKRTAYILITLQN